MSRVKSAVEVIVSVPRVVKLHNGFVANPQVGIVPRVVSISKLYGNVDYAKNSRLAVRLVTACSPLPTSLSV